MTEKAHRFSRNGNSLFVSYGGVNSGCYSPLISSRCFPEVWKTSLFSFIPILITMGQREQRFEHRNGGGEMPGEEDDGCHRGGEEEEAIIF